MHLPSKSLEKAYGTNYPSDDNIKDRNILSKKELGELLLSRAIENESSIEDDKELMQKLKNMEQTVNASQKYNPIIDKIIDFVNLSSTSKADNDGEKSVKGRGNA